MTALLAAGLTLMLIASPVLFAVSILNEQREQQKGFVFAVLSAALFLVTCSDRLPGSPDLRGPLTVLGGDANTRHAFITPLWGLWLLLGLYGVRFVVYLRLKISERHITPELAGEDGLYDLIVVMLAYWALLVCVVLTLGGAYALNGTAEAFIGLAGFAIFFAQLISRILSVVSLIEGVAEFIWSYVCDAVDEITYLLVLALAELAKYARTQPATTSGTRTDALRRRNVLRRKAALDRRKGQSQKISTKAGKIFNRKTGR